MNKKYDKIGRWYEVEENIWYPSVTTFLSNVSDHSALDVWKERIGEEEAKKESERATFFGSRLHEMNEEYVRSGKIISFDPFTEMMFNQIKSLINEKISNPIFIEKEFYSHTLQLAGTADLVCHVDGKLAILDYKTSKRKKLKKWLENYFIQLAAYAWMYREQYDEEPRKGVLIIAHKYETEPDYVEIDPRNYYPLLIEKIKIFRKFLLTAEK